MGKSYVSAVADSKEDLKNGKGICVLCVVNDIRKTWKGYKVSASPFDGIYADKKYTISVKQLLPTTKLGATVNCYIDEVDCDGNFYLEV